MVPKERALDDLLAAFEKAAVARERALALGDNTNANKAFKKAVALLQDIDTHGESGREALRSRLSHEEPGVRFLAATHMLEQSPEICVPVLEQLMTVGGASGLSAMMALKFYRGEYKPPP